MTTESNDKPPIERRAVSRGTAFERHAQTILSTLILFLLSWAGNKLQDISDRMIKVEAIQLMESGQRTSVENRLTRAESKLHELELNAARKPRP